MSIAGVAASRTLVGLMEDLAAGLTDEDWARPSGCPGWRMQDLLGHMAFFFNFIADPALNLPDNPVGTAEGLNDAAVRERAHWTPAQTLAYYREQAPAGLAALEALQSEELRDAPLELVDLGTYRMAQLADAVAFDHLVHLISDMRTPRGPLDRPTPDLAPLIDPAIDWMLAGLVPMCGRSFAPALTAPVGLRLIGDTERTAVLLPGVDGPVLDQSSALPKTVATSSAAAFLEWATTRTEWRDAVTLSGDADLAAAVLDAINIV